MLIIDYPPSYSLQYRLFFDNVREENWMLSHCTTGAGFLAMFLSVFPVFFPVIVDNSAFVHSYLRIASFNIFWYNIFLWSYVNQSLYIRQITASCWYPTEKRSLYVYPAFIHGYRPDQRQRHQAAAQVRLSPVCLQCTSDRLQHRRYDCCRTVYRRRRHPDLMVFHTT